MAAATVSCTKPASTTAPRGPVTLRIGVASPRTGAAGGVVGFVNNLISDPLMGIGLDGRPSDRLVTPQWSADGLALTLQLHPNLQFHDGTPVDLAYFRNSLEKTLRDPRSIETAISYRSITAIEAEQPDKVVIRLSRREAFLLTDLANSIIPHPTNPEIGLGPFRLVTRTPKVRLAGFENYYRGRPSIDFIEVENFEEQRSSWAALMRGDIDAVNEITPGAVDFVEAEGQTKVRTFPFTRPYFISLFFNVRHPILKNRLVRQALSYAVDRQAIIDAGLSGQGIIAEGPIWPFHWAYSTAQKTYSRNIEAAILRLDSAGLRMTRTADVDRMPARFRFRCLTVEKDARYEKIAMVLQKQLFDIGVDMEVEALPGRDLVARIKAGTYDAVLMERTSGRSLAWAYYFFHSTYMSLGYNAADGVLDRLRGEMVEGNVRTAVSDLQQIFHDDPPAIFIAWPQVARAVSTQFEVPVQPVEKNPDVMSSLRQWKAADVAR